MGGKKRGKNRSPAHGLLFSLVHICVYYYCYYYLFPSVVTITPPAVSVAERHRRFQWGLTFSFLVAIITVIIIPFDKGAKWERHRCFVILPIRLRHTSSVSLKDKECVCVSYWRLGTVSAGVGYYRIDRNWVGDKIVTHSDSVVVVTVRSVAVHFRSTCGQWTHRLKVIKSPLFYWLCYKSDRTDRRIHSLSSNNMSGSWPSVLVFHFLRVI